ncbi:MAG: GatB/YqeY [Candidatus Magasanikbacteria bacterium GW2011_GWC2_37_14]|uniref:GatB/YqeY n=1 Tax=Candidatus Magasanikbacteria bacterium GW2011_GWC2_37_14 TaxID=1619046 RepID=A0A0G0GCF5_9BACT|nr:MAG: GatB/YqeY [Candidatus Magasanikbacteria bacterium GW2011_GWC2_37_14]
MSSELRTKISADQLQSMKEKDEGRLSILRILSSALKNAEIEKQQPLDDSEIQAVLLRQVKQLQDSLADFKRGGREDLVLQVEKEIAYLQVYLPKQLSKEEIEILVKKILERENLFSAPDVGKTMGLVMKELKGKADGNIVREVVSKFLQK